MTITTAVTLPAVHPFNGMDVTTALAARVAARADHPCFIWEPGPDGQAAQWTYTEFSAEVDRVAAGLAERGVQRGDAVMLLLENSPAFAFCWFACARLGAVAVDTNTHYTPDELDHALHLTDPVGIVTHAHLIHRFRGMLDRRWLVEIDDRSGTCPALSADPSDLPTHVADPGAPLCVQFTSGTTSRPKAVLYTHANALWAGRVGASHSHITADDVFLVYMPLFHTAALMWHLLPTLWAGGTVVVLPKYTASRFWEISLRHRCTQMMLLGIAAATLADQDVPAHHYRQWQFALEMPQIEQRYSVRLIGMWGMTEVITNVLVGLPDSPGDPGAVGRVAPEYRVRIVDPAGRDTGPGEAGELVVHGTRGLSLFAEYLHDPAATADAFDAEGYFRSGDSVLQLPSGVIQYVTRLKDMLKVGGENVASAEIERVCMGVAGVVNAAVVGRRDPMLDEVPVAFVVAPGADHDALGAAVIAACTQQLADFKVPRTVHVIDELPEGLIGKILKTELRTLAAELASTTEHHS